MKNIIKNILVGGVAVMMFASCDMNLTPTTMITYDENKPLFVTATDVEQFKNGVLASYRSLCGGSFTQPTEVMCDAFNATVGFGNNYGSIHRTDASFTTSDSYAETMWSSNYAAIKNYNIVLAGAEKELPEGQEDYVELLKGTTYFCRASAYLTLARHFGNAYDPATAYDDPCVPLVLKYDQYAKPARASVGEVYDQILSDLLEAEYIFEYYGYQAPSPGVMEPTIDAVYALLARYYLDTRNYTKAAEYAEKVINSPASYVLCSTLPQMKEEFYNDGLSGGSKEAILQMYAEESEGQIYNTLYTMVGNDKEGKYFASYFLPSQNIINAYENADLRYLTWFTKSNKDYTKYNANITPVQYPIFMNGTRHDGIVVFVKYLGNRIIQTGDVESGGHSARPLLISEMYLIAAEAHAKNGSSVKAKKYLNALQEARKATATDGTMENIKKEWFRETVGEGHRLSCLKRWGDGFIGRPVQTAATGIAMTGPAYNQKSIQSGDYVLNWPVPSYEMKLNPNLVQNPGYGE